MITKARGIDTLAKEVALHADYVGIARIMAEDKPFPNRDAYAGMITVLQGNGPLSYQAIEQEFSDFLAGTDDLPLLTLTVVDLIENGQDDFDPHTMERDFQSRFTNDVFARYTAGGEMRNLKPLGQAYLQGGADRIKSYMQILKDIAAGDPAEVRERYANTTFFRA